MAPGRGNGWTGCHNPKTPDPFVSQRVAERRPPPGEKRSPTGDPGRRVTAARPSRTSWSLPLNPAETYAPRGPGGPLGFHTGADPHTPLGRDSPPDHQMALLRAPTSICCTGSRCGAAANRGRGHISSRLGQSFARTGPAWVPGLGDADGTGFLGTPRGPGIEGPQFCHTAGGRWGGHTALAPASFGDTF